MVYFDNNADQMCHILKIKLAHSKCRARLLRIKSIHRGKKRMFSVMVHAKRLGRGKDLQSVTSGKAAACLIKGIKIAL